MWTYVVVVVVGKTTELDHHPSPNPFCTEWKQISVLSVAVWYGRLPVVVVLTSYESTEKRDQYGNYSESATWWLPVLTYAINVGTDSCSEFSEENESEHVRTSASLQKCLGQYNQYHTPKQHFTANNLLPFYSQSHHSLLTI